MDLSDPETIQAVWNKGAPAYNLAPDEWRRDDYDNLINRDRYGNRDSDVGWEIDHIKPKSEGGSDDLSNLRPLYWEKNIELRRKA